MLRDLISDLRRTPPLDRTLDDMAHILADVCAVGPNFNKPLKGCSEGYTRTCAYGDERFEILLLNWAAGSVSAVHDHGGQHCWLAVLSGELRIDDYRRLDSGDVLGHAVLEAGASRLLAPGELDLRSGRFDIHRVVTGNAPAISLHVYSRPLQSFLIYDEHAQRCKTVYGIYDDVLS